jgi:D-2-hydroxyacid dehydrogenase (NADP+)
MTSLPQAPTRVLISSNQHVEMAAMLGALQPTLEIRGRTAADVTPNDLEWAEAYLGFRPPPVTAMGSVQWVHSTGAGVDAWLYPHALSPDILLTRSSESFGPMIAEWTLSRALACTQRVVEFATSQREHKWEKHETRLVRGTTAVVVGTGDVGSHVGASFRAMGCNVLGVSRSGTADETIFHSCAPASELATVVAKADWLLLMLPLTDETHHLINRDILSHCKGAILINAGRGQVLEESVLPEALERGWLSGAALDVFEVEPLPASSPLWTDPRVMVSPHISGVTTMEGAVRGFLECLEDLRAGRAPKWVVRRERQY